MGALASLLLPIPVDDWDANAMRRGFRGQRTMSTDVHVAGAEVAGSGIDNRLRAVEERLGRLETRFETEMKRVATKADLEMHFNRLLRWGLGIMITATGALSAIIFGLTGTSGN